MATTTDFVRFAERVAASSAYYYQGAGRCDPVHSNYADCSGLVVAALRACGIPIECTGSFALARMGHQAGAGLSLDTARRTKGALLYIGTNQGQGGRPGIDPGHVAISRGDGTTVEARNRRAGIGIFDYDNRGWSWVARNHWLPAGGGGAPTPTPPTTRHPTIRRGDHGPAVTELQHKLNVGAGQGLTIDGDFGPATERAVRNLQTFLHLQVDGIVGPQTWAAVDLCYKRNGGK